MSMRITTSQTQKQILAPVMQQSISILMLSLTELSTSIEQELQSNPMLEAEPVSNTAKTVELQNMPVPLRNSADNSSPSQFTGEDDEQPEIPIAQSKSLEDHLMIQLRIEITDPAKRKLGELIIGNLDADGYLTTGIDEIAWLAKTNDMKLVEEVLRTVQLFDPVGIASRDIKECLLNQIRASNSEHRHYAYGILENHFNDFFQKHFEIIAKKTNLKINIIQEVAQFISTLEPKPARAFQGGEQTVYIQPDVYVLKDEEGSFHVEVNKTDIPAIRINPLYMKLLKDPHTTDEDRKFIQEKLTNAVNFIKSIQQRGETLRKITRHIVDHQKIFFEGNTTSLAPLALKDIAEALDRNESTISRAIHNKYMQTPLGIFPLRFFFSQAVNAANKDVSAHSIKEAIKTLIDTEDKANPLSDQDILDHFEAKGLKMARRTINKYRQELEIPPSHQRKQ
jgi:RNA polymerase sigma-54 factor